MPGRMTTVRTPSAAAATTSDSSAGRHAKVATGSVGESSSSSRPGGALPYTHTPLVEMNGAPEPRRAARIARTAACSTGPMSSSCVAAVWTTAS